MAKKAGLDRRQIAALPVARNADGELRVLIMTSRGTKRFIVPKGWPMKKRPDHEAAEIEAMEEAGLIGRAHPEPIGAYQAWKRMEHGFAAVTVDVYLFMVLDHADAWKEKGQRTMAWMGIEQAAALLDEPGLAGIVLDLPRCLLPSVQMAVPLEIIAGRF